MIWKYLGTMKPERIFCMQNMNTEKKVCLTFVSFECFNVCSPIDSINPCIASCKFLKGNFANRLSCLLRQHLGTSSTFSFLTSKISVFPFKYWKNASKKWAVYWSDSSLSLLDRLT